MRKICVTEKRNAMRKTFHISLSSHDEVLFRSEADLIRGFNGLALAVLETDSRLLADGFPTTHFHGVIQADSPDEVMARARYAYARYFNAKYKRRGRLAERQGFILEVDGYHHTLAALNYVNRQGLHHGLSPTPFGYLHCSSNAFFAKQLGKMAHRDLMPNDQRYKYIPKGVHLPPEYRMDASGLLLREDILDVSQVESVYVTPRNYLFQMNKVGDEMSLKQQQEEASSSPLITLELIEQGTPNLDIAQLLRNETGKHDPIWISDLDLCQIIDESCLPKYCKVESIYEATVSQRAFLYDLLQKGLWRTSHKRTTDAQLRRCLCLK